MSLKGRINHKKNQTKLVQGTDTYTKKHAIDYNCNKKSAQAGLKKWLVCRHRTLGFGGESVDRKIIIYFGHS